MDKGNAWLQYVPARRDRARKYLHHRKKGGPPLVEEKKEPLKRVSVCASPETFGSDQEEECHLLLLGKSS